MLSIEWLMVCFFFMQTRGHNLNSYCLHIHLPTNNVISVTVCHGIHSLLSLLFQGAIVCPRPRLCSLTTCRQSVNTKPICVFVIRDRSTWIIYCYTFFFCFLVFLLYVLDTRGHPCVSTSSRPTVSQLPYHPPICHCPHHPYAFNDLYCLLLTPW